MTETLPTQATGPGVLPLLVDSRALGVILTCSDHHVERLACRRIIPSVKLGRLRRFRVSDVLAALERRAVKPRGGR